MQPSISRLLPLALVFTLAGTAASAVPIYYTMTATATGTLGSTPFTAAAITVTSVADTTGAFVASGTFPDQNWQNNAFSSTITIAGIGTETFTDLTFWADPNGANDIIFGDVDNLGGFDGGILGFTTFLVGLDTYNLQSAFGPVSGAFDFETESFNEFQNIKTSGGLLSLVASNDTFTASTPEPASFLFAGMGLLGLLVLRRARA